MNPERIEELRRIGAEVGDARLEYWSDDVHLVVSDVLAELLDEVEQLQRQDYASMRQMWSEDFERTRMKR